MALRETPIKTSSGDGSRHVPLASAVVAWVSVMLIPVAIFSGRAASIAYVSSQGYSEFDTEPPGVGLVGFVFLALIVLVPVAIAVLFGRRAVKEGRPSGRIAATIALVVGGGVVLLGLPVFLARIIGWPGVLAIGAVLGLLVYLLVRSHPRWLPRIRKGKL